MANLLDDFIEDIIDIVDETPEVTANPTVPPISVANPAVPPISIENYGVPLTPPTHIEAETPNKQKGK